MGLVSCSRCGSCQLHAIQNWRIREYCVEFPWPQTPKNTLFFGFLFSRGFTSPMSQRCTASCRWSQHLPADVLEHHIFSLLSVYSLVVVSMVCRRWRSRAPHRVGMTTSTQNTIVRLLFEDGASVELFRWFEQHLHFPSFLLLREKILAEELPLAKGMFCFTTVYNLKTFILSQSWILSQSASCKQQSYPSTTCAGAARNGHLELLKHLRANGCQWSWDVCTNAARGGHLEVLKWARANGAYWDDGLTCAAAAEGGHLDVLKWVRANGAHWDGLTCAAAARAGHLELLKWARANGCEWDSRTTSNAALRGHLEVLQWARANGCKWDASTCAYAAQGGHLAVLQWARENGCKWNASTCAVAAARGHSEVLKWALENGCEWDARTCTTAAPGDLRENGCHKKKKKKSAPRSKPKKPLQG